MGLNTCSGALSCGSSCLFLCSFGFPCTNKDDCSSKSCTAKFCDIGSAGTLRLIPASNFQIIKPNATQTRIGSATSNSNAASSSSRSTSRSVFTSTPKSTSPRSSSNAVTVTRTTYISRSVSTSAPKSSSSRTSSNAVSITRTTYISRSGSSSAPKSSSVKTSTPSVTVVRSTITAKSSTNIVVSRTVTKATTKTTVRTTTVPVTSRSTASLTSSSARTVTTGAIKSEYASFGAECLNQHNIYRAQCETLSGKPIVPLTWDVNLARDAKIWADNLAVQNRFYHSTEKKWGHGENLYAVTLNGNLNCKPAVDAFFNEYKFYNNEPIGQGNLPAYGHFTQLAWPNTTSIGCAYADGAKWRYTVCEYRPPGNYAGRRLNVRVKGKSSYK